MARPLLFYGHPPAAVPFQGGVKCVRSPTVRTINQSSGGNATGIDCSGSYTFDFNAWIQSGVDASLVVGAEVDCQYWTRGTGSASKSGLTEALTFVIGS